MIAWLRMQTAVVSAYITESTIMNVVKNTEAVRNARQSGVEERLLKICK